MCSKYWLLVVSEKKKKTFANKKWKQNNTNGNRPDPDEKQSSNNNIALINILKKTNAKKHQWKCGKNDQGNPTVKNIRKKQNRAKTIKKSKRNNPTPIG